MADIKKVTPAQARVTAENRVPMGVRRAKLGSPNIEGYVTRWFNDDPAGRIAQAQAGGWEFVGQEETPGIVTGVAAPNGDLSERVARIVGTNKLGHPIVAYLMKIRREWFEADQAEKEKATRETDLLVRKGLIGQQEGDGRYVHRIAITAPKKG